MSLISFGSSYTLLQVREVQTFFGAPLCICNSRICFTPVIELTSVPLYSATITQLSSYVQEYLCGHNGYCVEEDTHTTISIFTVCSLLHCNLLHDTAITDQLLRWISGWLSLVRSGQLRLVVSGWICLVMSGLSKGWFQSDTMAYLCHEAEEGPEHLVETLARFSTLFWQGFQPCFEAGIREVHFLTRLAVMSLSSLCLIGQLKGFSTPNVFPRIQCEGRPFGSNPYLRHRASWNELLYRVKPWSCIGRTVTQVEAPFSQERSRHH